MPIGLGGAAAITAGAGLLGQGGNMYAQGKMNKQTRYFNNQMWNKQFHQNLINWHLQNQYDENIWNRNNEYMEGLWNKQNKYNEQLWHQQNAYNEEVWNKQNQYAEKRWQMENEYNSPEAQMARFKAAGLNPHLIYGQQSTGGSIDASQLATQSQNTAPLQGGGAQGRSDMRSSSPMAWNPQTPKMDVQDGIMSYFRTRQLQAQTNNLEERNRGLAIDNYIKDKTKDRKVESSWLNLNILDKQDRILSDNVQISQETMRARINLLHKEVEKADRVNRGLDLNNILKQYETELNANGFQKNDEIYWRFLSNFLAKFGIDLSTFTNYEKSH